MTDEQFREMMAAIERVREAQREMRLDILTLKAQGAEHRKAVNKLSEDCLRYHQFQMDGLANGVEAVDMPDELKKLFGLEDEEDDPL